jgi:hypothetical protein
MFVNQLKDNVEIKSAISKLIDDFHTVVVTNTFQSAARAGWINEEGLKALKQAGLELDTN